jgi:radical SAM superfamily enzyme YgiQ (UPF0313 family)
MLADGLPEPHPKGTTARVLLTSVFGPYGQDDEYGSRAINPMELYQNQVTRAQGPFSLRMFHRSWALMLLQENISAPSALLDFPTRERFCEEVRRERYDVIGISSIVMNVGKVREMCRLIRQHSPGSRIVVGGHVAALAGLESMIDADYIVRGEGVRWLRAYLGEDPDAAVRHPAIVSSFGRRALGIRAENRADERAATVIPSVGCPLGCNFCATSKFFGGKGHFQNFYESGADLFAVMERLEQSEQIHNFFIMDENFLLYRRRAVELLACMKEARKSWSLYVFSSANALRKYSMGELVALGISWVWMGLESPGCGYSKLHGADTRTLVAELQHNGVKVLGSTIIGLEHHTPENVRLDIAHAVSHATDFHQFMLYTPLPGTDLYRQMEQEGRLLQDVDPADIHGQYKFNFRHKAIPRELSKALLDWAFEEDFRVNGPSLYRICRTTLQGWRRHCHHTEQRIRERFWREARGLHHVYPAMLWAMERFLRQPNPAVSSSIGALRREIQREFGMLAKCCAHLAGPFLLWTSHREAVRLKAGFCYEPSTFLERKNWVPA